MGGVMRKLLAAIALSALSLSGAAVAADLEVAPVAPAYKVAYAPFTWTGFYIGVHAGGLKDRGGIPFGTWQDRFIDWFRDLGFLGKPGVETKAARDVAAHVNPPPRH